MSQRQQDARRRVELAEQQARAEAVVAQQMIDEFVAEATRRGIAPTALRATTLQGHQVKTDRQGWYLRQNQSIAIGTDGGYYVLTVPAGAMARLTGVKLQPTDPPLVVGRGGRDGETGDLREFLDWRLAAG
ncbi:hypothetical protein GCM10027030_11110 [Luteococcus sediminum]